VRRCITRFQFLYLRPRSYVTVKNIDCASLKALVVITVCAHDDSVSNDIHSDPELIEIGPIACEEFLLQRPGVTIADIDVNSTADHSVRDVEGSANDQRVAADRYHTIAVVRVR